MPAATQADVNRVNDAVSGLGTELKQLEDLFNSLRNGPGLSSSPPTTGTAAPAATNFVPILVLVGGGLLIFFLLKGR